MLILNKLVVVWWLLLLISRPGKFLLEDQLLAVYCIASQMSIDHC